MDKVRRRGTKAEALAFLIIASLFALSFVLEWIARIAVNLYDFFSNVFYSLLNVISSFWVEYLIFRLLAILLIFFLLSSVSIALYVKYHIDSKSEFTAKLRELNKNTYFHPLMNDIKLSQTLNSKKNLDNSDPKMAFYSILFEGTNPFQNDVVRADENERNYLKYTQLYDGIVLEARTAEIPLKNFPFKNYYQKNLLKFIYRLKLNRPVINPRFIYELKYSSPTGKNLYNKTATYYKEGFSSLVLKANEDKRNQERHKNLKLIERRKLNSSMRFKILKRDGYRCQICGFSAPDGANLHIDHKVPIAKGGLTVESNLWTVCAQCNLGKGTKKL